MIFPARIAESIFLYTVSTYLRQGEESIPYTMIFSARMAESIFLFTDVTFLDKVRRCTMVLLVRGYWYSNKARNPSDVHDLRTLWMINNNTGNMPFN